jgi:hypothetical protein
MALFVMLLMQLMCTYQCRLREVYTLRLCDNKQVTLHNKFIVLTLVLRVV